MEQLDVKVSFGNKKLPKGTVIFNIPAVTTCPFRTPLCERSCYALKAERLYPQVLPARQHNLDIVQKGQFKQAMKRAIVKHYKKIKTIRVHESGDFFKQSYLNDWYELARMFPEFTFYAYTKSFYLDFSNKPDNFVLIASFDETTDELRKTRYEEVKPYFDNTFTIVSKKAKASCIQDCSRCNICWTKKGLDITVNKH